MRPRYVRSDYVNLRSTGGNAVFIAHIVGWGMVGFIVYESLSSSPHTENIDLGDKLKHFLAYFITMAWFAQLYGSAKHLLLKGGFLMLLAGALELTQLYSSNRVYDPFDIGASIGGVLGAFLLPRFVLTRTFFRAGLNHRRYKGPD